MALMNIPFWIRMRYTSLMTSSGLKIGQILKSSYLRQFLSYSIETKTEMQRWLWDIILFWLTSGVTSGLTAKFWHQNGGHFENAKILHAASIWYQIWKASSQSMQEKVFFVVMTSSMTSQGDLKVAPLCSLYKWNMNIFRDNWKTNKGIIIKLGVHMYPWILASKQSPDCPFRLFVRLLRKKDVKFALARTVTNGIAWNLKLRWNL